ncbi:hypothetical protein F4821DRAFT_240010 [Hypoxylon rubiginosum]|uniref:Uncharacterized protein n=1 Tax=Hypoxylon rubiginosum TaxID=110542 RepID=A0ACC0CZB9_9PEZI|nr:hypothetical protein F4821DRAFT_240010 [Hypoxylon rubiginosum]
MWLKNARAVIASALVILNVSSIAHATAIPPPTGPYHVGVRKYTIKHYNDHDPIAPNHVSTAFLATVFYPTAQIPEGAPKPYLNPETAAFYEDAWNFTSGTLASLTSTVQPGAPFLETRGAPHPTLLFGPGGGGTPVEGSTILLAELASHGYAVVGLDHPFEQPFVRFPNGTGVAGVDIPDDVTAESLNDLRLEDNAVFLDLHLPRLVREKQLPLSTTRLGAFGFSVGGAAALGTAQSSSRVASGLNLDGTLLGGPALNNSAADVRKPVYLLGNEGHTFGEEGGDYTWVSFPRWQTAYQRKMLINGTTHLDFCDDTFWKTLEDGAGYAGSIDGFEQIKILNAYVRAFFDLTLLGRNSAILDGPSPEFPEVVYFDV